MFISVRKNRANDEAMNAFFVVVSYTKNIEVCLSFVTGPMLS